jgi:hypothetical protein
VCCVVSHQLGDRITTFRHMEQCTYMCIPSSVIAHVASQPRTMEGKGSRQPLSPSCRYRSKPSHKMRGTSLFRHTTRSCQHISISDGNRYSPSKAHAASAP